MKPKDFEDACEYALGDWLWDESLSRNHTVKVSLSVYEMRLIANILRANYAKKVVIPMENTELNREKYAL